jgi:DNA mismatch repair ATPase MutL
MVFSCNTCTNDSTTLWFDDQTTLLICFAAINGTALLIRDASITTFLAVLIIANAAAYATLVHAHKTKIRFGFSVQRVEFIKSNTNSSSTTSQATKSQSNLNRKSSKAATTDSALAAKSSPNKGASQLSRLATQFDTAISQQNSTNDHKNDTTTSGAKSQNHLSSATLASPLSDPASTISALDLSPSRVMSEDELLHDSTMPATSDSTNASHEPSAQRDADGEEHDSAEIDDQDLDLTGQASGAVPASLQQFVSPSGVVLRKVRSGTVPYASPESDTVLAWSSCEGQSYNCDSECDLLRFFL